MTVPMAVRIARGMLGVVVLVLATKMTEAGACAATAECLGGNVTGDQAVFIQSKVAPRDYLADSEEQAAHASYVLAMLGAFLFGFRARGAPMLSGAFG